MPKPRFKSAYIWLALCFVGVSTLLSFIAWLDLFNMPSAMGVITMMIAGMAGGQRFFVQNDRIMTKGERLRFALIGASIMVFLSIGSVIAIAFYHGGTLGMNTLGRAFAIPEEQLLLTLMIGLGVAWIIGTLMTYLGAGLGQANQRKAKERAAKH